MTLTPAQNCINNHLNGNVGNYAQAASDPLSGEDSECNILPLCRGKRSFLCKVVFTDAHNAERPPPRSKPALLGGAQSVECQCAACEARSPTAGGSLPGPSRRCSPCPALPCPAMQAVRGKGDILPQGNKTQFLTQKKTRWVWGLSPGPYTQTGTFPLFLGDYLQSYFY